MVLMHRISSYIFFFLVFFKLYEQINWDKVIDSKFSVIRIGFRTVCKSMQRKCVFLYLKMHTQTVFCVSYRMVVVGLCFCTLAAATLLIFHCAYVCLYVVHMRNLCHLCASKLKRKLESAHTETVDGLMPSNSSWCVHQNLCKENDKSVRLWGHFSLFSIWI